ncbi:MAG TPA: 3-octaprenyl-4-hydroxybenzoate carboxy-lyase, partial [Fibrobacteria bacterium]|nr:3-octaprenyl-4-hydroxybenzoate carboxy-lyase [Fibrobacteria bacterium]
TVVGRPPQEDSHLAEIIHEFAGPVLPAVLPGIHAVHAVEAAGVHPLLLAIAGERYVPYDDPARRRPRELLTHANALLGFGQLSLAKYLLVAAREDAPGLSIRDVAAFLRHVLERADWERDLHFQTRTTMDTLDYSGTGLNEGSKVVIAAAGPRRRELVEALPAGLEPPEGFTGARMVLPGVMAVSGPAYRDLGEGRAAMERLAGYWEERSSPEALRGLALVIVADDASFLARDLDTLLWATFTRSDPARDIHGLWARIEDKHWGCRGPLLLDARIKPHHAPPLVEDPAAEKAAEALAAPGGSLHGIY